LVFLDAPKSWRHVKAPEQRTARDFAICVRDLADTLYAGGPDPRGVG
jgi:hypothetical protein